MKNNKGFTLIELIVSIGLILVLFMVAVPVSTNLIQNSNKKHCNMIVEELLTNAELYAMDNKINPNLNDTKELSLQDLYNGGYIEEDYDFKNGYILEEGILKDENGSTTDIKVNITKEKYDVEGEEEQTDGYNKYVLSLAICD